LPFDNIFVVERLARDYKSYHELKYDESIFKNMKPKVIAWSLVGGTAIVTGTGLFFPQMELAAGSVLLGGCAVVMALYTWTQAAKQRIGTKMLEQLR